MESRLVRPSDSPLVHSVTQWTIGEGNNVAVPDGLWDLVIYRRDDQRLALVTGQTTRAVPLAFAPGDEVLTISFRPGAYLSFLPGPRLVDRAEVFEVRGSRFSLDLDTLEVPRFDNAEDLVRSLQKRGVLRSDELVSSYFSERPWAASLRSVQRHFQHITGLSPRSFFLIDRARRAASLLQAGLTPSEVAARERYSDQAHLSRSLRAILGQTPGEIRSSNSIGVIVQDRGPGGFVS